MGPVLTAPEPTRGSPHTVALCPLAHLHFSGVRWLVMVPFTRNKKQTAAGWFTRLLSLWLKIMSGFAAIKVQRVNTQATANVCCIIVQHWPVTRKVRRTTVGNFINWPTLLCTDEHQDIVEYI